MLSWRLDFHSRLYKFGIMSTSPKFNKKQFLTEKELNSFSFQTSKSSLSKPIQVRSQIALTKFLSNKDSKSCQSHMFSKWTLRSTTFLMPITSTSSNLLGIKSINPGTQESVQGLMEKSIPNLKDDYLPDFRGPTG